MTSGMIDTRSSELSRDNWGIHRALSGWFEIALSGAGRLRAMEGVRGVSVILVFFVHYVGLTKSLLPEDSLTEWSGKALALLGNRGVDLFFILSGFLIYGTLIRKTHDYRKFMARRIERIYPTFLVVLALYLVLSFAVPSESKLPSDPSAAALLLLANVLLLPGIFDIEAIITVAWSLSYEFFFYLTVPALVGVLGLRRWRPRGRMALQVVTIVALVWVSAFVKAPHLRMVYFVAGMAVFELVERKALTRVTSVALDITTITLFVATLIAVGARWLNGAFALGATIIAFMLLCVVSFRGYGLTYRWLTVSPLRWLGNMSYSYYLIHGLSLKALFFPLAAMMQRSGENALLFWGLLIPAFLSTLVPSALLFLFVEKRWSLTAHGERPAVVRT